MDGLGRLGSVLVVSGILVGAITFLVLSYSSIGGGTVRWYWFWQGPVLGGIVALIGAALVLLKRTRGQGRTSP